MAISSRQFLAQSDLENRPTLTVKILRVIALMAAMSLIIFLIYNMRPLGYWAAGGIAAILFCSSMINNLRMRRIAKERQGEDICSFTRALNYRQIDTYIIRAVYEELSEWVSFPIRPTDRFHKELKIRDMEDLFDILFAVAERVKRSLNNLKKDPSFDRDYTVEELINFLQEQEDETTNQ